MGKLAFFGAVAGAGSGISDVADQAYKSKENELDAERRTGLERMKSKLASESETARHDRDRAEDLSDTDAATEVATSKREDEQTHATDIQTQKDEAAMERTLISSGESDSLKNRYKFHTETTEEWNPETKAFESSTVTTMFDTIAATPFQLHGNKFVPEGTDPTAIEEAPQDHVSALYANASEEAAEAFLRTYDYLPRDFMRKLGQVKRSTSSQRRRPVGAPQDEF